MNLYRFSPIKTKENLVTTIKYVAEQSTSLSKKVTGEKPAMWGPSIIGFGDHTYVYESGRIVDFFTVGFSSRADRTTIYIMAGYDGVTDLLKKLGPHEKGVGCLYIKDVEKVHKPSLRKIIDKGYNAVKNPKKRKKG